MRSDIWFGKEPAQPRQPGRKNSDFYSGDFMLNINQEHPEYAANRAVWKKYRDLYVGGEEFRRHAAEYLVRRNKEPNDVYIERLDRVFYENYIGSIIDWFAATLMTRE